MYFLPPQEGPNVILPVLSAYLRDWACCIALCIALDVSPQLTSLFPLSWRGAGSLSLCCCFCFVSVEVAHSRRFWILSRSVECVPRYCPPQPHGNENDIFP